MFVRFPLAIWYNFISIPRMIFMFNVWKSPGKKKIPRSGKNYFNNDIVCKDYSAFSWKILFYPIVFLITRFFERKCIYDIVYTITCMIIIIGNIYCHIVNVGVWGRFDTTIHDKTYWHLKSDFRFNRFQLMT